MKDWLTASEIAAAQLPDMPASERGVQMPAERSGWDSTSCARRRPGRGGATEYHTSLFPTLAQVAWSHRHLVVETPIGDAPAPAAPSTGSGLTARATMERDAKLAILAAYQRFTAGRQANPKFPRCDR